MDRRARIAALAAEIERLEREQDEELIAVIASVVQGRAFSSAELFAHQAVSLDLRDLFAAAGLRSARHLGKFLQRVQQWGTRSPAWRLERIGEDVHGAIWSLGVIAHSHTDASPATVSGV